MSGWKEHILGGVMAVGIILLLFRHLEYSFALVLLITVLYSLLPDLDSRSSIMTKIFIVSSVIALIILCLYLFRQNYLAALLVISVFVMIWIVSLLTHRGIMHSFLGASVFSLSLLVIGWIYVLVGFAAYTSHLLIDGKIKLI